MPARTPERRHLTGTVAAIIRHSGQDDPRVPGLRAQLELEKLAEHIQAVVSAAPPLTDEQRDRLALLLRPGGRRP